MVVLLAWKLKAKNNRQTFTSKVNVTIKASHWVLHVQETEHWLTVVHILVLSTDAVSRSSISDLGMHCALVHNNIKSAAQH